MWLTGRITPDHRRLQDFRKDSGGAIKQVLRAIVELCRLMGLLTTASVRSTQQVQGGQYPRQELHKRKVERRRAQLERA